MHTCASGSKLESMVDFFVKFLNACVSGLKVRAWLLTNKKQTQKQIQNTNKLNNKT